MKIILIAFASGVASFISPCVLPLIPGYLSLISGVSAKEMMGEGENTVNKTVFYNSVFFVVGFSLIFTIMGVLSSSAGGLLFKNKLLIQKFLGIILFVLGLHISGILSIPLLNIEKRKVIKTSRKGYIQSMIVGISFGFGWSPCIGPFLGSVLVIASTQSKLKGGLLLFIYSLGLGLPFIIAGLLSGRFFRFISKHKKVFFWMEKISGLLISLIGILMFFDKFSIE